MFKNKKKEEDRLNPGWVKVIAEDAEARKKTGLDNKALMEQYLEYVRQGMSPNKAMDKAKRTLACFKGGDTV